MLTGHLDFLLDEVKKAAQRGADAEARFRETVRAMVLVNADSKDLQIVLLHDLHNLDAGHRAAIVKKQRDIIVIVSELVRACDARRKIERRTLMVQTMMLIGMINYTYIWYDPAGPVTPAEYAELVSGTYLGGLRA
jgi:hypothetical protein